MYIGRNAVLQQQTASIETELQMMPKVDAQSLLDPNKRMN
jgi:hypothetical protein